MKVHIVPGVDSAAAARDLLRDGAVGIDDIGEQTYDLIRDEIFDELGPGADEVDWAEQRVETALGPVFVLRARSAWTAPAARAFLIRERGEP